MNLHLIITIDIGDKVDLIFLREVGLLDHFDLGIFETLLGIIILDNMLGLGDDIWGKLLTWDHTESLIEVLLFAPLGADEIEGRHTRLALEFDHKPRLITGDFIDIYFDLGIETLTPEAFHGVGDILTGDLDTVADI